MLYLLIRRLVSASSKCSVRWKFSSSSEDILVRVLVMGEAGDVLGEEALEFDCVYLHLKEFMRESV